jgi:hypothetical protein
MASSRKRLDSGTRRATNVRAWGVSPHRFWNGYRATHDAIGTRNDLYQTAETLTHPRHRPRLSTASISHWTTVVFAMDVPVGRQPRLLSLRPLLCKRSICMLPRVTPLRVSTRASSQSPNRAATATGRIFGSSASKPASSVAASRRTPITSDSHTRARSAARSAMSSPSPSVEGIIAPRIARATSGHGGGRSASTRSRLPATFGKRRSEWESSRLNQRGPMVLPKPPTSRMRK